jgi:hypothetical protein
MRERRDKEIISASSSENLARGKKYLSIDFVDGKSPAAVSGQHLSQRRESTASQAVPWTRKGKCLLRVDYSLLVDS